MPKQINKKITFMDKLRSHPIIGFFLSVMLTLFGKYSIPDTSIHLPPVVMEIGQLMAWIAATVVGAITLHGWYLKHFKKQPNDSTKETGHKLQQ